MIKIFACLLNNLFAQHEEASVLSKQSFFVLCADCIEVTFKFNLNNTLVVHTNSFVMFQG